MTAKEQAEDLVKKFRKAIWKNGNPNHIEKHAKQCALVAANLVFDLYASNYTGDEKFWSEVIDQLEKM